MSTVPAFAIPQNHVTSDSEKVLFTNPDQEPHICLMIDNYDSFTWNIYEYLCQLGADMMVKRNDEITLEEIEVSQDATLHYGYIATYLKTMP